MKTALVIGITIVATIGAAAALKKFAPGIHGMAF